LENLEKKIVMDPREEEDLKVSDEMNEVNLLIGSRLIKKDEKKGF
jgi:hypothetical protein